MKAIQVKQVGGPEAMELAELPIPQPKANEIQRNHANGESSGLGRPSLTSLRVVSYY